MKRWIFFDAMGVIFEEGDDTNNLLIPFIQRRNKYITSEEISQTYVDASLGRLSSDEFWHKMNICKEGEEERICLEYLNSCLNIDDSFIKTAVKLKKNYHLAILSNDVKEWAEYLRRKFCIDKIFDEVIISGEVMCRKPDIKIYNITLDRIGVTADQCIFIDDRDKNLIPAMQLGIKVVKFLRDGSDSNFKNIPSIKSFSELETIIGKVWE